MKQMRYSSSCNLIVTPVQEPLPPSRVEDRLIAFGERTKQKVQDLRVEQRDILVSDGAMSRA